jgi:hypothetical protein
MSVCDYCDNRLGAAPVRFDCILVRFRDYFRTIDYPVAIFGSALHPRRAPSGIDGKIIESL